MIFYYGGKYMSGFQVVTIIMILVWAMYANIIYVKSDITNFARMLKSKSTRTKDNLAFLIVGLLNVVRWVLLTIWMIMVVIKFL